MQQQQKKIYPEAAVTFSVVLGLFLWEWCGMLQAQPGPSLVPFPGLEGCRRAWAAAEEDEVLRSSLPCWEKGKSLPVGVCAGALVLWSSAGGLCKGSPELFFGCFVLPSSGLWRLRASPQCQQCRRSP